MQRYIVHPERSTVVVEARSSVGPIAWEGIGPTGEFAFEVGADGTVETTRPVAGWLELPIESLASGNRLYDAELQRRVDARRHPRARVELQEVRPGDDGGTYVARGTLAFHGGVRQLEGELALERLSDGAVVVTGTHPVDIRDFGLPAPTMLMLKVFPDVRVHLVVEGTPVED